MQQQAAQAPPMPEQAERGSSAAADAPPKQVALAMDRLGRAGRLIADVRLGADRLLEALLATADTHQVNKSVQLIVKEEASMRQHLQDLRTVGRQLEESGVLNGYLRSRGNSWSLNMPLVCPDGAVVAYAWKRQLAGQAGASAVDRTRLAVKAFTDQKRRFFPHLEDEPDGQPSTEGFGVLKRHCGPQGLATNPSDDLSESRTLSDILINFEREAPNVKIFTYQRLDWLKRASSLSLAASESPIDTSKEQTFQNSHKFRSGSAEVAVAAAADQVAVIELLVPSVFRAVLSLHSAGSTNPDGVAFFSPDEGGNYVHARGFSVYNVFKCITEHADKALQYFLSVKADSALSLLLHWICSYQTLFTKACSKCSRLLIMDKPVGLLLPPVHRPYRPTFIIMPLSTHSTPSTKSQSSGPAIAYHIGCYSDEIL